LSSRHKAQCQNPWLGEVDFIENCGMSIKYSGSQKVTQLFVTLYFSSMELFLLYNHKYLLCFDHIPSGPHNDPPREDRDLGPVENGMKQRRAADLQLRDYCHKIALLFVTPSSGH
jgi:hypothetical protein